MLVNLKQISYYNITYYNIVFIKNMKHEVQSGCSHANQIIPKIFEEINGSMS